MSNRHFLLYLDLGNSQVNYLPSYLYSLEDYG